MVVIRSPENGIAAWVAVERYLYFSVPTGPLA